MTSYEIILELCKGKGIAPTALEKELGFGWGQLIQQKTGALQPLFDVFPD